MYSDQEAGGNKRLLVTIEVNWPAIHLSHPYIHQYMHRGYAVIEVAGRVRVWPVRVAEMKAKNNMNIKNKKITFSLC